MPPESALAPISERVADLNRKYRHRGAETVLECALSDPQLGRLALVSSFGAESAVLLHLIATLDRAVPVLFIDTEMLFPETLAYQAELAARLHLSDLRIIRPRPGDLAARDKQGDLHRRDMNACCALRKTEPLQHALRDFDAWITGRKRYQGGRRKALEFFEAESGAERIKINPLAHWDMREVQDYMARHGLPRHPLVDRGYPSIGCAPCTTRVAPGEDLRAGRWRDSDKDECGIHFADGKAARSPDAAA